jgi:molecular chaperone GrpE
MKKNHSKQQARASEQDQARREVSEAAAASAEAEAADGASGWRVVGQGSAGGQAAAADSADGANNTRGGGPDDTGGGKTDQTNGDKAGQADGGETGQTGETGSNAAGTEAPSDTAAELAARLAALEKERNDCMDRWQRSVAEFDNYKRRTAREKEALYIDASADVIGAFLPIVDSLERAAAALCAPAEGESEAAEGDGDSVSETASGAPVSGAASGTSASASVSASETALREGILLIEKQVQDVLKKFSIEPLPGVGAPFDPNLHNAVMHVEDESYGKNVVAEVFQKGYIYKERVIRHSMVKVAN